MIFRGATSLWGALEGVGPQNRDFFGPWNGTSESSAIWAQKSYLQAEQYTELKLLCDWVTLYHRVPATH
jgi:hypothetical protein